MEHPIQYTVNFVSPVVQRLQALLPSQESSTATTDDQTATVSTSSKEVTISVSIFDSLFSALTFIFTFRSFVEKRYNTSSSISNAAGMFLGWCVGTLLGVFALLVARSIEVAVSMVQGPLGVARAVHVSALKLVIKFLGVLPGGTSILKVLNGYIKVGVHD